MNFNPGKLIQYRCCKCKRLLFKYRIGDEGIEKINGYFVKCPNGKFDIVCDKCNTRQQIVKGGLREIELVEKSEREQRNQDFISREKIFSK